MYSGQFYALREPAAFALSNKLSTFTTLLVLYIVAKVIYAALLSPTKHIPGALLSKAFGTRLTLTLLRGNKMYFAAEQHRRYGPLVEISPGYMSCDSTTAVKTVYGSHKWRKSRFYSDFADFNGVSSLFSETKPERAQILRRAFLPAFSRANLVAMAPKIFSHINKFLVKLDEFEKAKKPMEVYRWTRYLTFEVVTDVGFGGEYDMISSGELNHPFVRDFDESVTWGVVKSVIPWADKVPDWLMGEKLTDWRAAADRTLKHAQGGLAQWRHHRLTGKDSNRVDILQRLIQHGEKYPDEKLTEQELETEIMEIMLAGGDTTATTVTYGLYELAKNSQVQEQLRAALRDQIPDPADMTLERLEAVPYLDWTVKEMLRTHPTLPSLLERVVPAEGAQIAGYHVPGGSIIGMSAWSMNKSPDVFPDPLAFRPERFVYLLLLFLTCGQQHRSNRWENSTPEMTANMLSFSTGPRSCVGQNLAITQTRIHIGTILRNFRVDLHPDTTPEIMRTVDNFQGKPLEDKVFLFFKRMP
ncbi:hypothetical protein NM208_g12994 [Fusarium decemcellulare]|uniref:Uncharacterized protein n=1 Tax=Fusarium decemcellulare TaxID=57161 RepID=A0ACC1RNI1_9HYPO|nr:hypothetical protein NM208_g12994 [Fusarium decemcellulare]